MNGRPELSGAEWMDRWLPAQGQVQFQLAWLVFGIGLLAGVGATDPERARSLLANVEADVADFEAAAAGFVATTRDLLANVERNLP